jgi:hypothetical protein
MPTLGLIGSGSRLRASQRDCSMMARSPLGERRPPMSRRMTTPLLRSVGASATSLARSGGHRDGEEENELGFSETRHAASVLLPQDSRSTVDRQWMIQIDLGRVLAQVGNEICGPGLRCLMRFCAWAGPNRIWPLGRLRFKFFC